MSQKGRMQQSNKAIIADERKDVALATVSVNHAKGKVQRQVQPESSKPEKTTTERTSVIPGLPNSASNRRVVPQPNEKTSTSAPNQSPAQGNIAKHQGGSGKRPTVDPTVAQGHSKSAPPKKQAPTPSVVHPALQNPNTNTPHGAGQATKRPGTGFVPQSHKPQAVNQSGGKRAEAVTEEEDWSWEEMTEGLEMLDERIDVKIEANPDEEIIGLVRLILIGGAYARATGVKTTKKATAIDVLLDLQCWDEHLVQIRDFLKRERCYREFSSPGIDTKKISQELFDSIQYQYKESYDGHMKKDKLVELTKDLRYLEHTEVFVMDNKHAFDFELRRWADQSSDKLTREIIVDIADSIWRNNLALRGELWSCGGLQDLISARAGARDQEDPIDKFLAFCKGTRHETEKKSIVNAVSNRCTCEVHQCANAEKRFNRV